MSAETVAGHLACAKLERIRVIVVDSHALFRNAVRDVLDSEPDIRVVGEAGSTETGITILSAHRPDVMLLDSQIAREQPAITLPRFGATSPDTRIIVLTMDDGGRHELANAVRRAARDLPSGWSDPDPGDDALSEREREVLELVSHALSNRQIARKLSITEGTVKRHLRNIFKKLDAVSRIDAVNKGFRPGVVDGIPRPRR